MAMRPTRGSAALGFLALGGLGIGLFFGGLFGADLVGVGRPDFVQFDFDPSLVASFVFAFFALALAFAFLFRFGFERFFEGEGFETGDGRRAVRGAGGQEEGGEEQRYQEWEAEHVHPSTRAAAFFSAMR
jgi:hypothetical protein